MNNWKVIPSIVLATVLIFGAGVFTGGLLVNRVKSSAKKIPSAPVPAAPVVTNCAPTSTTNAPVKSFAPLPEILSKPFLMKLDEQLKLSADQHKAVEKIINDGQDDIKKTMKFSKMQIREVLTPEQSKQFDSLFKKSSVSKKSADMNAAAVLSATNAISIPPPKP